MNQFDRRAPPHISVTLDSLAGLRSSKADGKCVIDLITAPGVYSDSISEHDMTQAAQRVIDGCVRQTGPTEGGSLGAVGKISAFRQRSNPRFLSLTARKALVRI